MLQHPWILQHKRLRQKWKEKKRLVTEDYEKGKGTDERRERKWTLDRTNVLFTGLRGGSLGISTLYYDKNNTHAWINNEAVAWNKDYG